MDIEEYEYEMNEIINKEKEHEQDIKYQASIREEELCKIIAKQEKIINAMAEDIYDSDDLFNHIYVDGIEGIKQYYEKKVSEE